MFASAALSSAIPSSPNVEKRDIEDIGEIGDSADKSETIAKRDWNGRGRFHGRGRGGWGRWRGGRWDDWNNDWDDRYYDDWRYGRGYFGRRGHFRRF